MKKSIHTKRIFSICKCFFKNMIVALVIAFILTSLYTIFNNTFSIIEGVENKDDPSTSWTKLSVSKQIQTLIDKSNTEIENILNLSQGDPQTLDVEKLTEIRMLKKTLSDMENTSNNGKSYISNPFSKSSSKDSDDGNSDGGGENEESNGKSSLSKLTNMF